jgi:hypothetical protein
MESRVAAERIQDGVSLQKGNIRRPVIKGLVEGFQSLIFVADECRQQGDSIVRRRKMPLFAALLSVSPSSFAKLPASQSFDSLN